MQQDNNSTGALQTPRPRIVICGAGIGGLTLAARLAQTGINASVYEARSESALAQEGVFLTLAPNGMNGLRAIGCFDAVKAAGIDTTGIEILNSRGKRLALADQSDHAAMFGAPSITVRRGLLTEILLARARQAGAIVNCGARVTAIRECASAVDIRLQDGTSDQAQIFVAADGLRSSIRSAIFPEYPAPRFTGLVGSGGVTDAPIPETGGVMRMTFGKDAFFGYLKAPGQPVYWFNSFVAASEELAQREDPIRLARHIQALHQHDPSPNSTILAHVPHLDNTYPVFDMPELPSWNRGRVVLLGDAAHAVGPHAGQGASMAIEDAVVLAACIIGKNAHEAAFRRFESLRRARIARVVKLTARNSSQKRASGPIGLFLRDLILPLLIPLGIRTGRKLFAFRVDQHPLTQP